MCIITMQKIAKKSIILFFSFLGLRADDVIIGDMILTHEQYEIMYGKGKEIEIMFLVNCYLLHVPRLPS